MNASWPLWIFASIAKYFDTGISVHLHVEGDLRNTSDKSEWVELTIDGPDIKEVQGQRFKVEVSVHAMVCVLPSDSRYRRHELAGSVQALFTTIPLYTYGEDEVVQFGCLHLAREGRPIVLFPLPADEGSQIHQTQITGHYETLLEDT